MYVWYFDELLPEIIDSSITGFKLLILDRLLRGINFGNYCIYLDK